MSGLDLAAIREALHGQLSDALDGVFVYELWPGTPQIFPCVVLFPPDRVDYQRTAHRGLDMATWELLALAGRMSPTSQAWLEGLMSGAGDLSVVEALYSVLTFTIQSFFYM